MVDWMQTEQTSRVDLQETHRGLTSSLLHTLTPLPPA